MKYVSEYTTSVVAALANDELWERTGEEVIEYSRIKIDS